MSVVNARDAFLGSTLVDVQSALSNWTTLRVSPTLESKEKVSVFFREQLVAASAKYAEELSLCLDELVGNAIEHGCHLDPKNCVEISLICTSRVILIHVRDNGTGFSPDSVPHAAISNPENDPLHHNEYRARLGLRPGGYGILLVKQVADELIYNEAGNEVLMIKYLDPPPLAR